MSGLAERLREVVRGRLADRSLRQAVRRVLQESAEARVVLLAAPDAPLARRLGSGAEGRRVVVVDPALTDWQRHGRLAGAGPLDLLVDAAGSDEVERFEALFLLVRHGGRYVVAGGGPGAQRVEHLLHTLRAEAGQSAPARRFLARSVGRVRNEHGQLTIVRRGRTLAKLREREMNEALAADPSRGRVVATVPAMRLESLCVLRSSGRVRRTRTPEHYDAPAVHLREYLDVSCRPKSVVIQRGLVCPDTYRHHLAPRLGHKTLKDAAPGFVVLPRNEPPRQELDGTYFHLDNEIRGFFGHALTEQVSRLWAWREAKERHPDCKVLLSLNRGREVAPWELTLLQAGGIDPADVEVIAEPTRVARLLSATPMFSMPTYVHPRIVETWDAVGSALRSQATGRDTPSRIFCSRVHDKRACTNREEVEALFAAHGFEVVLPETMSLPDQVALFDRADVIGGFAGSGMFTSMFTQRPKHLVVITPDTYRPSNEYMISAVRGHRLDVAVGRSTSGDHEERLRAPFSFDMADEGAWLDRVLGEL